MNKEAILNIIDTLERASCSELTKEESNRGLCLLIANCKPCCAETVEFTLNAMRDWPDSSGNKDYPVPSSTGGHPVSAYQTAHRNCELYKGEYGLARKQLALFLVGELADLMSAQLKVC